jgi:hypothetical protein
MKVHGQTATRAGKRYLLRQSDGASGLLLRTLSEEVRGFSAAKERIICRPRIRSISRQLAATRAGDFAFRATTARDFCRDATYARMIKKDAFIT